MEPATIATVSEEALTAWAGLLQVHDQLSSRLDARLRRDHRLSLSSFEILTRLAEAPGGRLGVGRLAAVAGLSQSQASRSATELERRGLVERLPCPRDSRSVHVVLSARGRSALAAARVSYGAELSDAFVEPLGERTLRSLAAAWRRLLPGGLRSGCAG